VTPFEIVADALEDPAGRAVFVRGLMLGALAGAAVVGTVLRARTARRRRSVGAGSAAIGVAGEALPGDADAPPGDADAPPGDADAPPRGLGAPVGPHEGAEASTP
jgi:hypothetical protein